MKDRGKREVESYTNNNNNADFLAEGFPEFPCKKHPPSASSSSGGICAYCLSDRLVQLVCPQCGEQRFSSFCPCSEIFANTNYSSMTDNVGRISFLLENDHQKGAEISGSRPRNDHKSSSTTTTANNDEPTYLRRSNSISTAANDMTTYGYNTSSSSNYQHSSSKGSKKSETGKLWKIGRLFRKKREKENSAVKNNNNDENYECNGVSRSRSLCSFRGFYDPDENGGFPVSTSAARASSVSTGNFMLDSAKRSCFSESEARISNFDYYDASNFAGSNNKNNNNSSNNNNIFSLKETEFVSCDDPAFIDLKLNESNNNTNFGSNYNYNAASNSSSSDHPRVPPDLASLRRSGFGYSTKEFGYRGGGGGGGHDVMGHEMFRNGGGSCRISDVSERDLRKCRKSYKVWKWFSRHQSSSKFDDHDFKS